MILQYNEENNSVGISSWIKSLKSVKINIDDAKLQFESFRQYMLDTGLSAEAASEKYEGELNPAVLDYCKTGDAASLTAKGLEKSLNGMSLGAKAGQLALKGLALAGNMLLSMGISWLIGKFFEGIDYLIHYEEKQAEALENATENAKKYADAIKSIREESKKTTESAEEISGEYAKLAQGVNTLTNENVSLSTSDYERFLELNNELADLFPSLTKRYDENGNAILGLSGDVDSVTDSIAALVKQQKDLAKQDLKDNLKKYVDGEDGDGALTSVDGYKKNVEKLEAEQAKIQAIRDVILGNSEKYQIGSGSYNLGAYEDYIIKNLGKDIWDILEKGIVQGLRNYGGRTIDYYYIDYSKLQLSEDEKNKILSSQQSLYNDITSRLTTAQAELDNKNAEFSQQMMLWIEDLPIYKDNGQHFQNAISSLVQNIDWSKLGLKNFDGVKNYIQENILTPLQTVCNDPTKKAQVMSALTSLFTLDLSGLSPDEAKKTIDEYIKQLATYLGKDENELKVSLGFETVDSLATKYENALNSAKDKFGTDETQFFKEHSINTEAELDLWLSIANACTTAAEAEQKYLSSNYEMFSAFDGTAIGERLDYITEKFEKGELSHKEYFDALQSEIDNVDFSNYTESLEDATEASKQFFSDSIQQTATGLSGLINDFDNGKMGATEYLEGYLSVAETLSTLTDELQENSDAWSKNGKVMSDAVSSELDNVQTDLDKSISIIESYQDSIYSLEQIMSGAVKAGSDEFKAHIQVIAQDLSRIVASGGEMANEISTTLGTTTTQIAKNLTDNVNNQSLAAQAIASNTNGAITNMASSVGTLFDTIGKAISDFKVTLSGKWVKTGEKDFLGMKLPDYSYQLSAKGNSLTSIGSAISAFGKSVSENYKPQTLDLKDFSFSDDTPYTPSDGVTKNYNKALEKQKQSSSDAAKKALEAITGYFDWVKVRFDRLSRQTELAENAIERAVGLSAKQVSTNTAISSVRAEIETYKAGANKYLAHANWFASQSGLSSDIIRKIQNGSIELTKYDDITQEKISEFESYWSLYLQASDQILQLQDKEKELAQSRLENISNFYDLAISVHESLQGVNDAFLSFRETQGFSAVSDAVRKVYESSVVKAQKVYDNSLQKLNDYRSEFNSLVSQGYLQEGSDAWYEAKAEMNDFEKAVYEAGTSLQEFNDKITEISYQKIQNVIDGLERSMSKIESWISLQESRDEKIPESVYQEQLDTNNAQILQNKALRDAKLAEQALYDVNSTRYQELADDINDLDESTLSLMENNEKLKDQIFELRFSSLDEGIEKYDKLSDEIESFLGLLDEDAYFDKQGRATSELTASLALMSQKLSIYKQTIADLRVGLDKLQEAFDNGLISETEFNEKSEEYASTIRDTAVNAKELQDSLTSLYLEQMSKESEYLQNIIDKRKEALQAKADYYDYDRMVKGQRKSVSELDAQIAALQGTTNKAALSELKRLQQQRDEAQEELDETKRSHAQEMTLNGFDKISSDLDTILEDTEYAITHNADKQQSVISSMLNSVVGMYEDAYGKINSIINNTGWIGSNAFDSNQQQLGTQSGAQSQTNSALGNVSASGTANGINSSGVKDNSATNSQIESEIMQKEDITNRKVAELKVSPTAVTLEEGKSTSVTTSVRPTDAKKKQLSWNSSNTGVATVSNGTIRAVKPGTCIITVSTTDGSNIVQSIGVTVTKKPEPPKPAPKPATSTATNTPVNKNGGDGVPRVGDLVKFDNGRYYYSPDGASPTGNKKLGQKVYITKINPGSAKPYHISKGNKLGNGDLGWLRLDQLKGYRRGKNWFKKDEYAFTHNNEVIVSKDGGILRQLKQGDSVFTEKQSDNLQNWAKINPQMMFGANFTKMSTPNVSNIVNKVQPIHVENHYDSLLTVNGNVDKDVFPGVKKMCEEAFKYTTDQFTREGIKRGFRI